MARLLPALAALAPLTLAGCGAGEPAAADPLVVISGPKAFSSFELSDEADQVIWHLVAEPAAPVEALVYGEVPAGFRQETPAGGGRPRALMTGEPLRLESITPLRIFEHEGWVAGGQRLSIESWRMTLRNPPGPDRPDTEPARP